jgi:hypothetical protein
MRVERRFKLDAHGPDRRADRKDSCNLAKQNPAVRFDANPRACCQRRLAEYPQRTAPDVKDMTASGQKTVPQAN